MSDDTKIIRIVVDASRAIDGSREATKALAAIEEQTKKTSDIMQRVDGAMDLAGLATKFAAPAFAAKKLVDQFMSVYASAREAGSAISDMSEQLGVSTGFIQGSMYAAAQHTVALDKMQQGYVKASQVIGQAAAGQKEQVELFGSLGVKILDSAGKLRSTESILQDSAAAVLKIEDPARRVTAMMDLFGKSGAQLIPMLSDLAAGSTEMSNKAAAAGASMSQGLIDKLSQFKSRTEEASLKWNVLVAELGTPIATAGLDGVASVMKSTRAEIDAIVSAWRWMKGSLGGQSVESLQNSVKYTQGEIDRVIASGQSGPAASTYLETLYGQLEQKHQKLSDAMTAAYTVPAPPVTVTADREGASNPPVKSSGGESPEQKYRQLEQQLDNTKAAQDAMTKAALGGGQAFQTATATVDAQNKMLEIFKTQLSDSDPRLKKIRDYLLDIANGKAAEAFAVATTELQKQNVVLEAQNRLANEAPEIQARELAIIKAKQEAEKGGAAVTAQMMEDRRAAIEQNERLKSQAEDIRKAQELWTAPLKSALENIQSSTATWIDGMLQGLEQGKFSVEDFGNIGRAAIRRMIAEFASLAVIRPMLGSVLEGLSGLGIIGAGTVRQLGYSSSASGSSSIGGGIGGGALSTPLLGGGQSFGFLNQPIFGYGGALQGTSPAAMAAPNGATGALMGGMTWGQALSGVASLGIGAYGLASGNKIGGAAGILGGGLSLAGAAGLLGSWAGPVGMGIGLLGGLLGSSLFGGQESPTITNQEFGQLSYGGGGFSTSGGAWGPSANAANLQGPLANSGRSMAAIFSALGGVQDPSKVWGVALQSFSQQYGDKSSFSNQTSFLVGPGGQRRQWGQGSNASDVGLESGSVQAALNSILDGAVGDISRNMRTALEGLNASGKATFDTLGTAVTEIKSFDEALKSAGKSTTAAEQALAQVDQSFASLYATAEKYGLATGELDAAKQAARAKVGTDFATDIAQQILQIKDPTAAAYAEIDKTTREMLDNNAALVEKVAGYEDQKVAIEELAALKRKQIADDLAKQQEASAKAAAEAAANSVRGLQDLLHQLQYGDLSTASPLDAMSGTRATYMAALAQSRAGDASASANLQSYAEAYVKSAMSYYGSAGGFQAINQQVQSDIGERIITLGMPGASNNQQFNVLMTQIAELIQAQQQDRQDNAALREQVASLTAALRRAA